MCVCLPEIREHTHTHIPYLYLCMCARGMGIFFCWQLHRLAGAGAGFCLRRIVRNARRLGNALPTAIASITGYLSVEAIERWLRQLRHWLRESTLNSVNRDSRWTSETGLLVGIYEQIERFNVSPLSGLVV